MALPPTNVICIAIILSFSGSWHFGYHMTSLNPTEQIFREFLNETHFAHYGKQLSKNEQQYLWTGILNLFNIGGLVGTLMSSWIMEKFGRKRIFYVTAVLCAVGPLFCGLSYTAFSWELFAIGKAVSGLGIGIILCLQPTYFAEISSAEYSGFMGAMTGVLLEVGFMFGSLVGMSSFLGTHKLWPWLQYLELIPNIFTFVLLPFLPESPKFIMAKYEDKELAIESLTYFKHKNIDGQLKCIREEIDAEKKRLSVWQLLKKAYLRKGLILACVTQFAIIFSGGAPLAFFSTNLFIQAGASQTTAGYATFGMTCLSLVASIVSGFVVDKVGRKPLFIGTLALLALLDLVFMIFVYINHATSSVWSSYMCIIAINLFTLIYGLGPATVQWFIAAELMPQNARSSGIMFTMVVQWILFIAALFVYNALEIVFHEWTFSLFVISLGISIGYLLKELPETKNKDPVEIIKMLGYQGTVKDVDEETTT